MRSARDALDLYHVISTYVDAGNTDLLYDSELSLLEQVNYDLELAGGSGTVVTHSTMLSAFREHLLARTNQLPRGRHGWRGRSATM
jgi:predicted nucleotidyltransferase